MPREGGECIEQVRAVLDFTRLPAKYRPPDTDLQEAWDMASESICEAKVDDSLCVADAVSDIIGKFEEGTKSPSLPTMYLST